MDDLTKQLVIALQRGNWESARTLVDQGANINGIDSYDRSRPIHWAALGGHTLLIGKLLGKGAELSHKDELGRSPFFLSVCSGNHEAVLLLLGHGGDVKEKDKQGMTPLHQAAHSGYLDMITILLDNGANINEQSRAGSTPLHMAVQNRQPEAVWKLLAGGSDEGIRDFLGQTAFEIADFFDRHSILDVFKLFREEKKYVENLFEIEADQENPVRNLKALTIILDNRYEGRGLGERERRTRPGTTAINPNANKNLVRRVKR